ncbi:MAG: hypothetical protein RI897_585 [Verrucomicrobiota bacterium]
MQAHGELDVNTVANLPSALDLEVARVGERGVGGLSIYGCAESALDPVGFAEAKCPLFRDIAAADCDAGRCCIGPRGFLSEFYFASGPIQIRGDVEVHPEALVIMEVDGVPIAHVIFEAGSDTAGECVVRVLVFFVVPRFEREVVNDASVRVLG